MQHVHLIPVTGQRFILCPSVKYAFHCTDIYKTPAWSATVVKNAYTEFH